MFYLNLFVNCFIDLNYEKEFGNVRIPTIAPKISSFGIIMGYLLNARFPNHKSGDGWSPGKKPIDGTSEESDRLPGCLNFICGRFTPNYGSFRSIGITLCKEGEKWLFTLSLDDLYLFIPCTWYVSIIAFIDYYSLHGVKIHSRLVIPC